MLTRHSDIIQGKMRYRYLGNSGLKVSILGFGNWLNSNNSDNYSLTKDAIKKCFDSGINFFDTAEIYGFGEAESQMGKAFKELELRRESLVVSTKIFKISDQVNDKFMSRKHIIEGLRNSLKRLQLDYVDVVFSHRPDYQTPLEETCRAFSWVIDQGLAFYWGTSEWPASRISEAIEICERLNLHKPICEQPQYSMIVRERFEKEYKQTFQSYNYGTTIWSPLAGGLLTGKYNDGNIPLDSRFSTDNQMLKNIFDQRFGTEQKKAQTIKLLQDLKNTAEKIGFTQAQLALAWCLANKDVSVALLGFSKLSQIDENLKAIELYEQWNQEIEDQCKQLLQNDPETEINFNSWTPDKQRREFSLVQHSQNKK